MPLTTLEIRRLATALAEQWDEPQLQLFLADHTGVTFRSVVRGGTYAELTAQMLDHLSRHPPLDRQLLTALRDADNATLRTVARELLTPSYFSPTGDPHDAILLGRAAFVDRADLRAAVREFTAPGPSTTRLLVVRGDDPSGKSYTWPYLRHLAATTVGAQAYRITLEGTDYTPHELVDEVFQLLLMDRSRLPVLTDEPQLARTDPLIAAFTGQLGTLTRPYWLVVDDLNGHVSQAVADTVYALAFAVEDTKPENLWIALLGYNRPITASELRFRAQDDARFPGEAQLAEHLVHLAAAGPLPVTPAEALTYARLLLGARPRLTKQDMGDLTVRVEQLGERLRRGERP